MARKVPLLKPAHVQAHLKFANDHLDYLEESWEKVMWPDETKIELLGHNSTKHVWRKKNNEYHSKNTIPTVKHGGVVPFCTAVRLMLPGSPKGLVGQVALFEMAKEHNSAFNTIIPQHLIEKLNLLGLNTSLCNWILDFLTGRPQAVRIGNSISSTTTLSTGAPQGCVLSPLLFTLLTHDCAPTHSSNHIIKFADDTTVVGLISRNDESAYREEVQRLTAWCGANNLSLNVDKTKEMVVDFRRAQSDLSPVIIDGSSVEIVKSTKFLGVHLADNLTWSLNTSSITKKAQQRLYFLRRLRKAHLPPPILSMFYRGTIESILSSCITAWFGNCTVSDRKTLQRIVRTAEKIIGVSLPSIMDIYTTRCIRKAHSIVDDHTHPSHTYFTLLPSGKRFRSIRAVTTRLCNSFFPQAIRLLNTKN
ncbi:gastrula zinc finger protein XlCGF28.1-like [Silurus asotus]|uniref:Gastrula zinc finger protein XlCGF28.1-like n=1 Tax=Silurus asotus TaxID=30991 RepID=A0AAD5AGZ7_SILAS|nr:gastrula zinc finger protein XlCGF28.1-like [Silurus asotus]